MYPELFRVGAFTVHGYGFMIAMGIVLGVWYMVSEGRKQVGMTFDQGNYLFLLIFFAAFVGGKFFLFLEEPGEYVQAPGRLLSGQGFVFYGSFLFAIPVMLLFFRRNKLDSLKMLDVMAVTACIVHIFGRLGCFLAGCCYGTPTEAFTGVAFTHPKSLAEPRDFPLHPTQIYESLMITLVMLLILFMKRSKRFNGQLFLIYVLLYAMGRFVIEFFRGDLSRGFLFDGMISHSQFVAIAVMVIAGVTYATAVMRSRERSPV